MTPAARKIRLVAYLRVSSGQQLSEGHGLEVQRRDIKAWAKANDARIVRECIDGGVSGKVDAVDREAVGCALEAIRAGEADGVIVANLGRLGRKLMVQEAALALIWSAGGRVFTADDGEVDGDDDPMRVMVRQIIGAVHEFQRSELVVKLAKGKAVKAESGGFVGGQVPYGFASVDGDLVVVPDEQGVLMDMRQMRAEGASYRTIVDRLNKAGIPAKGGGQWYPATVSRIVAQQD